MSLAKAMPLFHPELRKAPAAPMGHRILLRPFAPDEVSEGGLVVPETAQQRPYAGTILAAGDEAAKKLRDARVRIGDEVWWAKFAGVIEEWQHIVKEGNDANCKHDGNWQYLKCPGDRMQLRECPLCGAHKLTEPVIVANVDDILCNVSLQQRIERGEVVRCRGIGSEGETTYYWADVNNDAPDGFGTTEPDISSNGHNEERIAQ